MNQQHILSFCHLELLDTYAVITCHTGAHIDYDQIQEIEKVLHCTYHEKHFGLIANRENQYSVNPLAIDKLFSDKFLVAGAIVGNSSITKSNADLENKLVLGAPIKFFNEIDPAIAWINNSLQKTATYK